MHGSPERRAFAQSRTASASAGAGGGTAGTGAAPPASFHAVSAGRMSVAMRPGAVLASAIARAPSAATEAASGLVFTQSETGRATPSTSQVSGASCRT